MTVWHIAMLLLLPLMNSWTKGRTWLALMGAGVVPWLLPPMDIPAYIVIDAVAGAIVLRRPAGFAQRAVGACFALLVMFHVGFLVSHTPGNEHAYYQSNTVTGWGQFTLLTAWGVADVGKAVLHWCWPRLGVLVAGAGIR